MSSWISATDPLALVAINAGQVGTPSTEAAALGSSRLDVEQRSIVIGEPVPIAFCRRRNGYGGILVSPGASEARFENDTDNDVTASYLLVVSEGRLPGIQVRDVFQGPCRVGTISQTYNRRAGTWEPGNAIVERAGFTKPEASYYCGSKGAYPGMTTVSFRVTIPNGFDAWKKQVHFYLRGGMEVTRLTDGQAGPSDNFCDLVRWMMTTSGRFPAALIDTTRLTAAARFLEDNNFTCNCYITESSNYLDYLAKWAPLFLLCESNVAGKRGLRPLLPITSTNQINTGAITPVFTFTENQIFPGSLEIEYTSLAERRPFVVQAIWREQLENDFGIIRTAEVRLTGTAADGPYESHDLSEFCTRETHAVKVAAHILARRCYTTHSIRFTARPGANSTAVTQGDIIRVRLARETSAAGSSLHDYLYQVQRITKTLSGELSYEAVHFPIDSQGRSLIALAVAAATPTGIQIGSNKTGLGCDLNSATDTTIPEETFSLPDLDVDAGEPIDIGFGGGGFGGGGFGGGGFGGGGLEAPPSGDPAPNPDDGLDGAQYPAHSVVSPDGSAGATPGNGLDPGLGVCGGIGTKSLTWYRNGKKIISYAFPPSGGNATITYETTTERIPPFLDATEGILAIGTGDEGSVYTSVVECKNGAISGNTTYVEPAVTPASGYYIIKLDTGFNPGGQTVWSFFGDTGYQVGTYNELVPGSEGRYYYTGSNGQQRSVGNTVQSATIVRFVAT